MLPILQPPPILIREQSGRMLSMAMVLRMPMVQSIPTPQVFTKSHTLTPMLLAMLQNRCSEPSMWSIAMLQSLPCWATPMSPMRRGRNMSMRGQDGMTRWMAMVLPMPMGRSIHRFLEFIRSHIITQTAVGTLRFLLPERSGSRTPPHR